MFDSSRFLEGKVMKNIKREVWIGLILLLISLYFLKVAQTFGEGSKYPSVILTTFGILSFGLLVQGIYYTLHPQNYKQDTPKIVWNDLKKPLMCFALVIVYVVLLKLINFFIATAIFIPPIMKLYGERSVRNIILTIIGLELFVYIVFVQILNVNFALM